MAGQFSGHLVNSYTAAGAGNVTFDPNMHGTDQGNQSFSMFNEMSLFNDVASESASGLSGGAGLRHAALQAKLNQRLGPEYVSQRPGPGGGPKLTYAEGWKMINLANEVFGFNGWSSRVVSLTTDFMDYSEESRRYNIGVTAIVRVMLRDGTFHEDIGYGLLENTKSKGQGLDKCKKEAVTDGIKRALRNFGNLMGNCLYDKSYTHEIVKMKVPPAKFDQNQLHRRPEFTDLQSNAASTSYIANTSMANNAPPPQYNRHAPQNQPPRNIAPPPVSVKTEPRQATTVPHPLANTVNDMKGKAPMRAYQTNFTAPVPAPAARPPADRHVSFAAQDTAATSSTIGTSPDNAADNNSDSFGFSDDDAFFASVVVDDLGPPIGVEADMGRPIEVDADSGRPLHEENDRSGVNDMLMAPPLNPQPQQPQQPANRSESKKGSGSRLAIIAAQLEQQRQDEAAAAGASEAASRGSNSHATLPSVTDLQPTLNKQRSSTSLSGKTHNENRNPNWQQPTGGDEKPIVKSSGPPPPMGGFNFPSGTSNPLQGLGAGMKRPMEMMAGEGSANHAAAFSRTTARSGMGLHQASNMATAQGGRQVLGRLDNGPDGGDAKRMRRFV